MNSEHYHCLSAGTPSVSVGWKSEQESQSWHASYTTIISLHLFDFDLLHYVQNSEARCTTCGSFTPEFLMSSFDEACQDRP